MSQHVFLVEDDSSQADNICQTISNVCNPRGLAVSFTRVSTEFAAHAALPEIARGNLPNPDLYIIDQMLPWARGRNIPRPADSRVLSDGPLRAGLRVIEAIQEFEKGRRRQHVPIILYTIAHEPPGSGVRSKLRYTRYQKIYDNDSSLALAVSECLAACSAKGTNA